jgi:ACR3 family arsenite transporter
VALCIVAGITLGGIAPGPFQTLGSLSVANVNIPVAVLIWLMIVPMLLRVDFGANRHRHATLARYHYYSGHQLADQTILHGASGRLFIRGLFYPFLPADQIDSYIAGLILLAAAPCTGDGVRVLQSF